MTLYFEKIALRNGLPVGWTLCEKANSLTSTEIISQNDKDIIIKNVKGVSYSNSRLFIENAKEFMKDNIAYGINKEKKSRRKSVSNSFFIPKSQTTSNLACPAEDDSLLPILARASSSPSTSDPIPEGLTLQEFLATPSKQTVSIKDSPSPQQLTTDILLDHLFSSSGSDPTSWSDTMSHEGYFQGKTSNDARNKQYTSIQSTRIIKTNASYQLNYKLYPVKSKQIILLRILIDYILDPLYQRTITQHEHNKALRLFFKNAVLNVMNNQNFNHKPSELEKLTPSQIKETFRDNFSIYKLAIKEDYLSSARKMLKSLTFFLHPHWKGQDISDNPHVAAMLDQLKSAIQPKSPIDELTKNLTALRQSNTAPEFLAELSRIELELLSLVKPAKEPKTLPYLQTLDVTTVEPEFYATLKHIESILDNEQAVIEYVVDKLETLIVQSGEIARHELERLNNLTQSMHAHTKPSYTLTILEENTSREEDFHSFYHVIKDHLVTLSKNVPWLKSIDVEALWKKTLQKAITAIDTKYWTGFLNDSNRLPRLHIAKINDDDTDFFLCRNWATAFKNKITLSLSDPKKPLIKEKLTKSTKKADIDDNLDKLSTEISNCLMKTIEEQLHQVSNSSKATPVAEYKDNNGATYLKF